MSADDWVVGAVDTFVLRTAFVGEAEERALLQLLEETPVHPPGEQGGAFRFAHPIHGGEVVRARLEAAAGVPVSCGSAAAVGARVPPPLAGLARRVEAELSSSPVTEPIGRLTSVYVDRYERGSTFVPHTDRDHYGPVVAGVSIGPGAAVLRFSDGAATFEFSVPARSLYAFCGAVRHAPWHHEVVSVSDRRFAITLRSDGRRSPAGRSTADLAPRARRSASLA